MPHPWDDGVINFKEAELFFVLTFNIDVGHDYCLLFDDCVCFCFHVMFYVIGIEFVAILGDNVKMVLII